MLKYGMTSLDVKILKRVLIYNSESDEVQM